MSLFLTTQVAINAPLATVWNCFTQPEHIVNWNAASDDWHTTAAKNNLVVGGKFSYAMAAKDGSLGFDFWGIYDVVEPHTFIAYTMGDGRKARINFSVKNNETHVVQLFEAENENPAEMQQAGWQMILDNFAKYVLTNPPTQ